MKKALLLLASAALLLVGCAKEQVSNGVEGGMTEVTFTANLDNGVATKASADLDGKGANVNRCIMEIYFQNQLYKRMEAAMSGTPATATFSNVPVVAGKQYEILFWADNVDVVNTEEGLAPDKYYTTKTEGNNVGLKAVAIKQAAFLAALEAGDNDKLDAFYGAKKYTVPQAGGSFSITLHRPFAQMNVITTDVASGKTVISADLLPETVTVSYTAATTFNVADSTATGSATYTYTAPVYGKTTNWSAVKTRGEFTLSMDYILADKEQRLVNVAFSTSTGMSHDLNNLPYQRNYRTNVKGDLLTTGGTWTATIAPKWGNGTDTGEINHIIASSYTEVVNALQSSDQSDKVKVTVTPAAVNNMSDTEKAQVIIDEEIDGEAVKALKFILYEEKKDGDQITQQASPKHVEFELPERPDGVDAWKIEYEQAYPTETVVVSTKEEDNANVIIEAPRSTVTLEATKINSVVSTTSENTLIIPQGLELKNLVVKKGAVEYHGTGLTKVKVEATGTDKVYFKTSEGLANTNDVYGVVKDYVAPGYAITKESETTWKIVPEVCRIGETSYASLSDAVSAAPESSETTIKMVNDVDYGDIAGDGSVVIPSGKVIILDLNGKKISASRTVKTNTSIIANDGTLTIVDNAGNGEIHMNSTVDDSGWSSSVSAITNRAVLTVKSGLIHTNGAAGMSYAIDSRQNGYSHDVVTTIEGGLIEAPDYRAIRLFANGTNGADNLVVSGGEIIGKTAGIWLQDTNVYKNKANVTISGGKITATGDTRHALYIDGNTDTEGLGVTITGGQFKSPAASVFVENCSNISKFISGGVFSDKPADELVADNYIAAENADATYPWKVVISPDAVTVAKIGTTEYYSLADALKEAKEGEAVYIIPDQLEETVSASNDNNIQLILDGKNIIGDITFGGKGTLIVRAEELNKDYYSYPKAYEVDAPTIPAQGVGGIMGKISATDDATVMLRENLYSGPFEGNVELRGGFYYYELGLDNIKAQTPSGIGLVVNQVQNVMGYDMYYVPEVPESYLVHIPAEFLAAGLAGQLTPEEIQQATLGYWLNEDRLLNPMWVSLTEDGSISLDECPKASPDDVYAFFTNLKDGNEYLSDGNTPNPKFAYQNWVCDFVISYSNPIDEDYKSGIWGYYSEMGFGCWLPKSATEQPVGLMESTFGKWEYSKMLSQVGMFLCGPKNLNPADSGKVITVSLNIYPDSETKTCITTNKVVYTIPAISE